MDEKMQPQGPEYNSPPPAYEGGQPPAGGGYPAQAGYPAQQGYPQGQYPQGQGQAQYPPGQGQGQYPPGQYPQGQPQGQQPGAYSPGQAQYVVVQQPVMDENRRQEGAAIGTMTGAYVASCVTIWFCGNLLFGLIGFILAIVGSVYIGKDNKLSRNLNIASIVVSVVGTILTIIAIIIAVVLILQQAKDPYNQYG